MEELRELVNKIIVDMRDLEKFLIESTYGKKTMAQIARVKTIELRKLFKAYNALSKKECPIRVSENADKEKIC